MCVAIKLKQIIPINCREKWKKHSVHLKHSLNGFCRVIISRLRPIALQFHFMCILIGFSFRFVRSPSIVSLLHIKFACHGKLALAVSRFSRWKLQAFPASNSNPYQHWMVWSIANATNRFKLCRDLCLFSVHCKTAIVQIRCFNFSISSQVHFAVTVGVVHLHTVIYPINCLISLRLIVMSCRTLRIIIVINFPACLWIACF